MLFSYLCNKISCTWEIKSKLSFPLVCIIFVIIDINSLQAAGMPAANTNGTYY